MGDDALDSPIAVLSARDTKGLEFDHVFVVDPLAISRQASRGSDIYVACTRATQVLHLVSLTDLPAPTSADLVARSPPETRDAVVP